MPASRTPLLGDCFEFRHVLHLVDRFADSDISVLITGETGTGKERVARLVHERSRRAKAPFRVLDCGGFNENLLESELFGHEEGAFTGATKQRKGLLEKAAGGTVFLDEIGNLPMPGQCRLLRFLQERTIRRVGGNDEIELDVRIVAATNLNFEQAVARGEFREDLYFRLKAGEIPIPPLRKRLSDLPGLATAILTRWCRKEGRKRDGFSHDALAAMLGSDWPGNIRELEDTIRKGVLMSNGPLVTAEDMGLGAACPSPKPVNLVEILSVLEARMIRDALLSTKGNVTDAAALLGCDRCLLNRRLKEYAIDPGAFRTGEGPPPDKA